MSIVLPVLLLFLVVMLLAFLGPAGLWGNLLTFVNVVLAALLATNLWEPIADWLTGAVPSFGDYWDLMSLWGLFAVSYLALRAATDFASRVKVKFPKLVELIGNYVAIAWTGWILVCFASMTLHTAPLAREFFLGAFDGQKPVFFGFSPDRQWLGFVQRTSQGALGREMFDPDGKFMIHYAARRERIARGDSKGT
jgi:hypothetical protein